MIKLNIEGVKKIVAVASGKGGVGKTTVSVNLALALQALGLKVGIFDADVYGPNVPLMLGVRRFADGDAFIPVVRPPDALPYIDPLNRYGLEVMSTGLLVSESQVINPVSDGVGQLVLQTIKDVKWGDLDILLLDLPPSAGQPQQDLLAKLIFSGAVIVTTPQSMSLLDASRSCQLFENHKVPVLGIVENMSYVICASCGEPTPIFQQKDKKGLDLLNRYPILGKLPLEDSFAQRITQQHPLLQPSPSGVLADSFLAIARLVIEEIK